MEYEERTPACQRLPARDDRAPQAACFRREPVQSTPSKPYSPESLHQKRIRYQALRKLAAELVSVPA